jgi:amino acid adenylation domain-containing protein
MDLPHLSVQDWFFAVAQRQPEAVAIQAPGRVCCYGRLAELARATADALRRAGATTGSLVAVADTDPVQFVANLIGVLAVGGVATPFDAAWPAQRSTLLLEIAQPPFAVGAGAGDLIEVKPEWLAIQAVAASAEAPQIATTDTWTAEADSPCYVFFTSGSTGRPKGIVGRTIGVAHFIDWEIRTFDVGPEDVVPMLTSPGFDAVLRDIFTPLCAGARIAAVDDRGILADPDALATWLDEVGATVWHTTPSLLRRVLQVPGLRLPRLRRAFTAGEALLPSDAAAWLAAFGGSAELVNLYGPSETTMVKLFHRVTPKDAERARVPIGRPMEGCRAIILNDAGAPAASGVVDEIYLRTPFRSLGYLRQPDLTRAVFVTNPLTGQAEDVIYRTGDLGRMDETGVFEFFGRVDWQLKIRGVRVEPTEVEGVLRRHPDVLDLAVVGHEFGEGDLRLCAYVVLRAGASIDAIRAFAAERLMEAMVPSLFAPIDRIPRNSNGKLERAALPDPNVVLAEIEHLDPRTPVEQAVVDILRETLEIERVSVTANFFTIGGHSLLVMQVLSRIEEAFGVAPPLAEVLENPTAETMAAVLEAALEEQSRIDEELQSLIASAGVEDGLQRREEVVDLDGRSRL